MKNGIEENEKYQLWNADVQKLIEAEAFLSTKGEQEYRIEQLDNLKNANLQVQKTKIELKREAEAVWKEAHRYAEEVKVRQSDLSVYEQFGLQAEKIEKLQQMEHVWKESKNSILHHSSLDKKIRR